MARFDLYEKRKWWWFYYYLSLAAAKGTPTHYLLKELIYDAMEYEVKLDKQEAERKKLIDKYNVKDDTVKKGI